MTYPDQRHTCASADVYGLLDISGYWRQVQLAIQEKCEDVVAGERTVKAVPDIPVV